MHDSVYSAESKVSLCEKSQLKLSERDTSLDPLYLSSVLTVANTNLTQSHPHL